MTKYKLTFVATFESDKEIPVMHIAGSVGVVLDQLEATDNPLQHFGAAEDKNSTASFTIEEVKPITDAQAKHGERIAARGRHNGTSEA